MTLDDLQKYPRKTARELLASVAAGRGYDDRLLIAVECAMNLEWWRGYNAAKLEVGKVSKPTEVRTR